MRGAVFWGQALFGEEGLGSGHENDVVVPAWPGTAFEVVQAQAALEFSVVVLNAPADLGQADQIGDRGVGWEAGLPVFAWCFGADRTFGQ